jgi:outer membrane protein TolC
MLRIQQAKEGYAIAKADNRPQVNFSATYNPTQTYVLPANGSFSTVDDDGWNVGITMRKKIWDFEKTSTLIEATKVDEDIAKLSLEELKSLLAYKVKSLYKLMVVQQDSIHVRERDLETKEAFYAQAEALVRQGLKTKADSYRFRSSVYVAKERLSSAQTLFRKAKYSLSLYMEKPISDEVILDKNVLNDTLVFDRALEEKVLTLNPKIQKDTLAVKKSKLLHHSIKQANYGSFDVFSNRVHFETLNSYNSNYVGLTYSVPIYSGGRMTAQEQEAKIGYQIANEQQDSDRMALKEELHGLMMDIEQYKITIEARKSAIMSAKRAEEVIEARYKEGLTTYMEVLDNTTELLDAELALLQAYYSKSLAYDRVKYLKGAL